MATPTIHREGQGTRPKHHRLATVGMGLVTATVVILGTPAAIQIPDARGFVTTLLVVALVGTVLVWRFDALWARVPGLLACLGVALLMFWAAFGLFHPASVFEFVAGVTYVLGVPLALVGNILAMVQRRRGDLDMGMSSGERHVLQAVAGTVALAVVVSGALTLLERESVEAGLAANATEVEMTGFEFEPVVIEVVSGDQVVVRNRDAFVHDFTVPDLDVEATVGPGNEVLLDIEGTAGAYVVYCTLHSDTDDPDPDPENNMVASLVVR